MGIYYLITTINACIWTPLQTLYSLLNQNNPSTTSIIMSMKYPQLPNRKQFHINQLYDIVEESVEESPADINHNWSNIVLDNQHADALVGEMFAAYRGTRLPTKFRYLTTDNILDFRYWDIEEISNAEELSTYWADQTYLFTNCTIDILLAIDIFF